MLQRIVAVAAAASLSLLGGTAAAQAQAQPRARPASHLHGVRVVNLHRAYEARLGHVKPGKIAGIVYARGHGAKAPAKDAATACTGPACPLVYNGGPVQHAPRVYLLLWGPHWASVPSQQASANYLESFYSGLGDGSGDTWSPLTSQYGDSTGNPAFTGPVLAGVIEDLSVPPSGATPAQIAAEADASAAKFGITDPADAQIVVATQSGTCPQGFDDPACGSNAGNQCGWHGFSAEPYINLPYLPDAGAACGEDFVNTDGLYDGFSLVGGDEFADTITDPSPPGSTNADPGWIDEADTVSGGEIADKCAFGQSFSASAPDTDVALSTGSFAMQSLWSNAAGGCAMSTAAKDTVSLISPGSQSGAVGKGVSVQLSATSAGGYLLTYFASGLPTGLSVNSHTGLISGTLGAAGTFSVTVRALDQTGASQSVSFTWRVAKTVSGPIKGDHGLCLDDYGGSTANGTKVDVWSCNNTVSQQWTFSGGALSVQGHCLDDSSHGGAGSKLVLWACNGHTSQTWAHHSNGEYTLKLNGLCLTDPSGSTTNGTQVVLGKCSNSAAQHWTLP